MDRVRELQPLFYGEYAVILQDGTRLTLSRSFRERVFQRLIAVG
jgi:two-component system LytT family response regulator